MSRLSSKPFPGFLPWQLALCLCSCGMFATSFPWQGTSAAFILIGVNALMKGPNLPRTTIPLAFLLGYIAVLSATPTPPQHIPLFIQQRQYCQINATIADVTRKSSDQLHIILDSVHCSFTNSTELRLPGKTRWTWSKPTAIPVPGQQVAVRLKLRPVHGYSNPDGWDYGAYMARQEIFYTGYTSAERGNPVLTPQKMPQPPRDHMVTLVNVHLNKTPASGILLGLLTGERYGIDNKTMGLFRHAGLAHSLALSGLHMGYVAALAFVFAYLPGAMAPRRLLLLPRQKWAILLALPLALAYLWMGDFRPSLTRAFVMLSIWGGLLFTGRSRPSMDALFAAVTLILIANPLQIHSVSLQFSALAVLGLTLVCPVALHFIQSLTQSLCPWIRLLVRSCLGTLACSLIATTFLLPVLLHTFGEFAPSLIWNLVWLPMLGLIILPLGLLGTLLACVPGLTGLATPVFAGDTAIIETFIMLLEKANDAGLTPALTPLRPMFPSLVGYALLLTALVAMVHGKRVPKALLLAACIGLCSPLIESAYRSHQKILTVDVLDVGNGLSIRLLTPSSNQILIDGSGSFGSFDMGKSVISQLLTANKKPILSNVFLSHPQLDHAGGLGFVTERFTIGTYHDSGQKADTRCITRIEDALAQRGIARRTLHTGDHVVIDDNIVLEVLHPPANRTYKNINDASLVLRLVQGGRGMALFPGDIEKAGLQDLLATNASLQADVLVLPHHGSISSFSPDFYRRVNPAAMIASSGFLNRYKFPSRKIRKWAQDHDITFFNTAKAGAIRVESDRWDKEPTITVAKDGSSQLEPNADERNKSIPVIGCSHQLQ